MDMESGFQIEDAKRMLRRRLGLIAGISGGALLTAIFVAAIYPNEYEAWSTLLVEPQAIAESYIGTGGDEDETNLNSRLHLMAMQIRSRSRLSRVIDDLNLYPQKSENMTREAVIEYMNGQIRVEPVLPQFASEEQRSRQEMQINTFQIFFRHESPQKAAAVANRLANDFIEEHIQERVQSSTGTTEFIDSELQSVSSSLEEVENQIARVKAENRGQLPSDRRSNREMLARTTEALRSAEQELSLAKSDAAFYRMQAGASRDYRRGEEDVSPVRRLQAVELRISELRSRGLTEKHPDMISAKKEAEQLREIVSQEDEEEKSAEAEEERPSQIQQSAQAEARRAELRAEAARQDIERLQARFDEYEQRIAATPQVEERLSLLQSRRASLAQTYRELTEKRHQAAMAASMERRQKGEQFRVLESAYPPTSPASPNRPVIVVIGLLLGLSAGVGVAFLLEASDSSFHEERSLQSRLGVPVLASVPGIVLEADRVAQRRRFLLKLVGAGAVTVLVLTGSVVGNWMVNGAPAAVQGLVGQSAESGGGDTPPAGG